MGKGRARPLESGFGNDPQVEEVASAVGIPDAIPYALRHSSIVRGLTNDLPIRPVAALHDTSVS